MVIRPKENQIAPVEGFRVSIPKRHHLQRQTEFAGGDSDSARIDIVRREVQEGEPGLE